MAAHDRTGPGDPRKRQTANASPAKPGDLLWTLAHRPLIREQAFGEALDPNKLERLGRYEVHLDRKLERMLAMLLRLKDLRQGTIAG